ncbi:hypothetical protein ES703_40003 [subsurface metagenome]
MIFYSSAVRLAVQGRRFVGDLCSWTRAQKISSSTESGPTPILAVRRIAQELLNESGRYQTTLESNTGQMTS